MVEEIYVLDKKVRLLQPDNGFRTSLDSVLLAAAVKTRPDQSVLDMGCGVGGASFCLLWRASDIALHGVDWHEGYIDLARRNNVLNDARAEFTAADIRTFRENEKPDFDHVMMNPPYFEAGAHTPSPDDARAQANGHQDENLSLDDWIRAAHLRVKSNGSLTIIYPASGTDKIIQSMGRKFGAIEILPLWQRAGQEAKRVIIRAVKDRKTPARLLSGLVLHQENGDYTPETEVILRDGNHL